MRSSHYTQAEVHERFNAVGMRYSAVKFQEITFSLGYDLVQVSISEDGLYVRSVTGELHAPKAYRDGYLIEAKEIRR